MHKRLFLSFLAIILITLLFSILSVNYVFQKQFSDYLARSTIETLEQLPERLSNSFYSHGCWDPNSLNSIAHSLPLGTHIQIKEPSGETILTLINPMETMMQNDSDMDMGIDMGLNYSIEEWKSKTLSIVGPEGVFAIAEVRYPARAKVLNPADQSFVSAIYQSLFIAGALVLLIGSLLSYWTSRRLISPLQRLTRAATRVGEGHLDEQVSVTSRDEVGQLATAFNEMADNLKKQEQLRKQFTADIAHELRTPLTSIRSYIEAFQDGVLPADNENLTIINEEIERLTGLSSDLKDLNVAEMGALQPNFTQVDISELIDKTVNKLTPLIQEKGLSLEWHKPDSVHIEGDEYLLTRLFYNLLHNAYKFTESPGTISIQMEPHPENIQVSVRDSGVGIPDQDLPLIFERFYRAEKSRSRETGGTGIGLALVKQITHLHQGTLKVESTQGEGSQFTILLPLNINEQINRQ
ncbi:signal transduction histidine kinase [Desulfitobacterium dichloroeliminans LMG P-21439]|uniref:histidine kinase n=1 Tax=Desulfitobacterium dichloroeliminans (strain LMG P-21439 / DCA1) TaxID=871963 RepID=L0F6F0_DESDL|nr:ATP-binding protein [Desulfitobacterium dichloroeliminans]AGA68595.1 signal transduction histidine kinase [Desulfitobacterium dichloroeliminans LMG P-21439]